MKEKWIKINPSKEGFDLYSVGNVVEINEITKDFIKFNDGSVTGEQTFKSQFLPLKEGLSYLLEHNKWEEIFISLEDLKNENLSMWKGSYNQAKNFFSMGSSIENFNTAMAHIRWGIHEFIKTLK